jgi:4-aminobutyrate aminotransferase
VSAAERATGHDLGVVRGLDRTERELERERACLAEIMKIRFYPFVFERVDGGRLLDVDGNAYLDFCAGGAVMNVGYANERVTRAVHEAMAGPWSTTSAIFAHPAQTELAERLASLAGGGVKVWFGTSGSEAMDTIGRYFRIATGKPRLISFEGAFHGQTGGSGALSGMSSLDEIPADYVSRVPYPDPYRCPYGPCDRDGCSLRCLEPLREVAEREADDAAGLVIEPIESDGGEVVPPANVLSAVREICDEHGLWMAVDEVKVGLGRTGAMFAHGHSGIRPDAIALGKALAGGLPLSAVIARPEVLDAGVGTCAYTLAGSPIPCAAALATLDELEGGLIENAARVGAFLLERMHARLRRHAVVGDIRGAGLILGLELVRDQTSRRPAPEHARAVVYRCFELGLLSIYTGTAHNVIELTPPLTVTEEDAELAVGIIDQALDDVIEGRFDVTKLNRYEGW